MGEMMDMEVTPINVAYEGASVGMDAIWDLAEQAFELGALTEGNLEKFRKLKATRAARYEEHLRQQEARAKIEAERNAILAPIIEEIAPKIKEAIERVEEALEFANSTCGLTLGCDRDMIGWIWSGAPEMPKYDFDSLVWSNARIIAENRGLL